MKQLSGRLPDLTAAIQFLTAEEGGRKGRVKNGYCPNHGFGDAHGLLGAYHRYEHDGWVAPGETVRAELWLLSPAVHQDSLIVGQHFTVQEGDHIVGRGRIESVLDPDLVRPPVALRRAPVAKGPPSAV